MVAHFSYAKHYNQKTLVMMQSEKLMIFILVLSMFRALNVYGSMDTLPVTEMGRRHYELAKQTELESIVLLENKEHILPLDKAVQSKIAVFGNGSFVPTNGSSGSGTVPGAFTYNLYKGLRKIGVAYDETVYNHYKENISVTYDWGVSVKVNHNWDTSDKEKWGEARFSNSGWNRESPIADPELGLEGQMVASAADFSSDKTAVVYITRGVGTEEMDRFDQPSDWYLNPSEYTLLKQVTRAFDQVIVILNTSGSMDLSWMDFDWLANDPDYNEGGSLTPAFAKACANKVKGLILSYGSGSYHGVVMAELLYGEADFSGKLADSMTKTYGQQPTKDNFHYVTYADRGLNDKDFNALNGKDDPIYLYQESIYTGYRYFDTFAADDVLYPFGYGLSYNTFAFKDYKVEADEAENTIRVSATIANVSDEKGLPAGKEVMEVYVSAPEGALEQPYQKLVAYAKTGKLAPGAAETVAVTIPVADLASYHEKKAAYVLEAGDYLIRVGNSSRNTHIAGMITVNDEIVAGQLSNKLTLNGADPTGKADNKAVYDSIRFSTKAKRPADPAVYGYQNPNDRKEIEEARASALLIDENFVAFTDNSGNNTSFAAGRAPDDYVATLTAVKKGEISRADFVAQMTKDELVNFLSGGYGARNSEQYYSDDPALQINHLTSKDAEKGWIGGAGSSRNIRRLGIPSLTYADGSAGIFISASTAKQLGIDPNPGFARAAGMACTWNPELQYQWGKAIGEEMRAINVDIWLAPSINLHRNPLNGRNTEYYSEDPVLSGKIAAYVAKGVAENGVSVCLKHFAGNDQEWYRRGLHTPASEAQGENKDAANTIVSERALREVTLKPFEIAVKSGQVMCVMSAFNKINGKYCAASDELLTGILRGEWHYEGFVVTDWGDFDEIPHAADEMRAGNDMIMSGYHTRYKIPDQIYQNVVKSYSGQPHTVSLDQLRRNAAHVLNTILFSRNAFTEDNDYNLEKHLSHKLEIMTTQLPAAIVGMDYAKIKVNPIVVAGSEGATRYTFSIGAGGDPLPAALSLHGNGSITGMPAPEDLGKYKLLVQVEDDRGNVATKPLELEVANQKEKVKDQDNDETTKASQLPVDRGLMLDPPDNSELKATIGKAFSRRITASGGTVESFSYTLSPKGDALPQGLIFQDGLISGKPEPGTAGVYSIVVRASEIGGSFRSSEAGYRLVVSE